MEMGVYLLFLHSGYTVKVFLVFYEQNNTTACIIFLTYDLKIAWLSILWKKKISCLLELLEYIASRSTSFDHNLLVSWRLDWKKTEKSSAYV